MTKHFAYVLTVLGTTGIILSNAAIAVAGYDKSSFYDWGSYYGSQKVLGLKAYAQEPLPSIPLPSNAAIPKPSFSNPDSPFYFLKTASEGLQTTFTFDPIKKEELRVSQANERLAEIKYLLDNARLDEANQFSQRYAALTEDISRKAKDFKDRGLNVGSLVSKLEEQAVKHEIIAENVAANAPPVIREVLQTVLESSQLSLDRSADIQGNPAIPQDLSESLQDLKKQGLITPEQSNKIYQLKTREEVRNELNDLNESGLFPLTELKKLDQKAKEVFPEQYSQTIENLKFTELRSYENLPTPSEEIVKKLEEFRANYKEGDPVSKELRTYLPFNRADKLVKELNLDLLGPSKEKELATFYSESLKSNPTFDQSLLQATSSASLTASPSASTENRSSPTYATPSATPYISSPTGVLPDNPFYFTKNFTEGFNSFLTFDPVDKAARELDYAEERLREASTLFTDKKTKSGIETLTAYQKLLETTSKKIKELPSSPKQKILANKLEQTASRHNVLFEKSVIPIPEEGLDEAAAAVKATQKAVDRAADVLDKPVVPPYLLERLDDLKQQGMLLSEEVTNIINSQNREEVREKLAKLEEKGSLPPADAKKLDEKQLILYPEEFNKLIEARKIEELQRLRQIQSDISQTSTLKQAKEFTEAKLDSLLQEIDLSVLSPEEVRQFKPMFDKFNQITASFSAQIATSSAAPTSMASVSAAIATPSATPLEVGTPSAATSFFQPPKTTLLPDNPLYFFKGLGDNITSATRFGYVPKLEYRVKAMEGRLNEAYTYFNNGEDKKAAKLFQEYLNEIKAINQELNNSSISEAVKKQAADKLDDASAKYKILLERIAVTAGEHTSGSLTAAIVETTKVLDKTADILGEQPVPETLVTKLKSMPEQMVSKETVDSLVSLPNRSEARTKIATLSASGAITSSDLKAFDDKILQLNPTETSKLEELKKVAEVVRTQEAVDNLDKTIVKNEEVVKKLGEFRENFKPGDDIPEDIRLYIPLSRLEELQKTIRPDTIRFEDFPNRNDIILSVATLREEVKPTKDEIGKVEKFKKDNPGVSLPPSLQRIEALVVNLGIREGPTACYLPTPPFPSNTPCPPPGTPIPVAPISINININIITTPGLLIYGQGPKSVSFGNCPVGYHWMHDSGGWCMSNTANYAPSPISTYTTVYNNAQYYAEQYGLPSSTNPNRNADLVRRGAIVDSREDLRGYLATTVINVPPSTYSSAGQTTSIYNPPNQSQYYNPGFNYGQPTSYINNPIYPTYVYAGPSSGSKPPGYTGPAQTSPGSCPSGYHYMSDGGGWCMSDSGTPSSSMSTTYGPTPGGPPNAPPTYYGPPPSTYGTDNRYGYTPGNSPKPVYSGVCPDGYHWMSDGGGWCMSNGGGAGPGTNNAPGSTPTGTCTPPEYWRQYSGCVKNFSPYGFCEANWSWVGDGCARVGSANRSYDEACGPGYGRNSLAEPCRAGGPNRFFGQDNTPSSGNCTPPEWFKDGRDCVKSSSPYGFCEANWYWVGESCARVGSAFGGFTAACGPGYTRNSPTEPCKPGSSPYPSSSSSGNCTPPEWFKDGRDCVKSSSPYGFCEANWYWVGESCARVGSAFGGFTAACGPGYTRSSSNEACVPGGGSTQNQGWGYCDAGWYWEGSGPCVRANGSTRADCGPGYSRNSINENCQPWGPSPGSGSGTGSCPSGWHFMGSSSGSSMTSGSTGDWCMADGPSSTNPPSWSLPICPYNQYWNGSSCGSNAPVPTTASVSPIGTCTSPEYWRDYAGCVKASSPYGFCEANWSWVGDLCARVGSATRSYDAACGPGYTRSNLSSPCTTLDPVPSPTPTSTPTPTPTSTLTPTPSSGTLPQGQCCPTGYHYMGANYNVNGDCMGNSDPNSYQKTVTC